MINWEATQNTQTENFHFLQIDTVLIWVQNQKTLEVKCPI